MNELQVIKPVAEYRTNPLGIDAAKPRLGWRIQSRRRGVAQAAYRIQVSEGDDRFESAVVWDTGKVASDRSVHVEYGGPQLKSRTRYFFRVRIWDRHGTESGWSETAYWETGLLDASEWTAEWISAPKRDGAEAEPADYARKTFDAGPGLKRATIYATAHGLYELHLNGERVGDALFAPGWTSYANRLQYQTYDVTPMIQNGRNAIGVVTGNGWYKGDIGWHSERGLYGDRRAALVQLHLTYEDGREETVRSDGSWTMATGPIRLSEIYHGETYDARLERPDWATADFDDAGWVPVETLDADKRTLIAQQNEPSRIVEDIRPVGLIRTPAGETVIDMGQNMVGWLRFTVRGEAGHRIVIRHAEILDKDGNFYTGNLRKAKQTIEYVCRGGGPETYEPHFTFQGFRYVKLEHYPGEINLEHFTGRVIHTDMEPTGRFECSEPLVNRLQHNILWGQKGNFLDVPTDCPQRDERLGWTGDAQVFIRTAAFLMNVAPFFTKWLGDLKADQFEDGSVPAVIPNALPKNRNSSSAWGDAAVICPWTLYVCYGDTRVLEEQFDSMKAWVDYIRRQGDNEWLWNTGFHYGDWLGLDAKEGSYVGATPTDLIATAFYAHSAGLVAKTAEVLGRAEDAETYRTIRERVVREFRNEFVTPNGRLISPTQTAHALALAFDLVDGETYRRTAATLAKMIEDNKFHLTTGFVGTPYLCHALSRSGYHETAAKLVLQQEYPSWLYSVLQGATTIWEHWDGIKPDGSLWSDAMNSFNHYAYGSIGDWLYQALAGLDTDESAPGYKRIRIRPLPASGFDYAHAAHDSMYGTIESGWRRLADGRLQVDVVVPPNTTADVVLPGAALSGVAEGGRPLAEAEGVADCRQTDDGVRLTLGSGGYRFVYEAAGV
ncbi:glycoside hydrolase family 78 protein [Paenibacillus flagellatus]|uniref:alpha-L-rhamnosidase n=1 Tax=Paenibacillus flagellatus TaxID=2211139 RepID=A0A2V5K2H2_9BACL|nr:glycoside hydrolase family 78 protein [Paenibacillus flagellatus]PYI53419.1 alpha-L-rhamnosidase [Paenibacillus flagellatus]